MGSLLALREKSKRRWNLKNRQTDCTGCAAGLITSPPAPPSSSSSPPPSAAAWPGWRRRWTTLGGGAGLRSEVASLNAETYF